MICEVREDQKEPIRTMSEIAIKALMTTTRSLNDGFRASHLGGDTCARRHAILVATSNLTLMHINYHTREHQPKAPDLSRADGLFAAATDLAGIYTIMLRGMDAEHDYRCTFIRVDRRGGKK